MFIKLAGFLLGLSISVAFGQSTGRRYYDKEHNDHHVWGPKERSHYKVYLSEKKLKVHTFKSAPQTERQDYWNWRHQHP